MAALQGIYVCPILYVFYVLNRGVTVTMNRFIVQAGPLMWSSHYLLKGVDIRAVKSHTSYVVPSASENGSYMHNIMILLEVLMWVGQIKILGQGSATLQLK